jgi:hypothetical protein
MGGKEWGICPPSTFLLRVVWKTGIYSSLNYSQFPCLLSLNHEDVEFISVFQKKPENCLHVTLEITVHILLTGCTHRPQTLSYG